MGNEARGKLVKTLSAFQRDHPVQLPGRPLVQRFADDLLKLLFPHFDDDVVSPIQPEALDTAVLKLLGNLTTILSRLHNRLPRSEDEIADRFVRDLPDIHAALILDAQALLENDPAAKGIDEVIVAYPGFFAISIYRVANLFHQLGVQTFPRMLTEYAHQLTGIDIHPGATIGKSFFIDHGTGVVIGETTKIGESVKLYQGVTLGALAVAKDFAAKKRHPTLEDRVVIYSNATILGGDTVIGHDSVIGGNVWLTESIPPNTTVYHKGEIKVRDTR